MGVLCTGAGVAAEGNAKLPQELPVGARRSRPTGETPLFSAAFCIVIHQQPAVN